MTVIADHPGVSTLIGTPKEISDQLGQSHADRVLVLAFQKVTPATFEILAKNFSNVASSMCEVLVQRHEQESLERFVEILLSRTTVLESGDGLTAAQVAKLAGFSARNPSAQLNKWKKQGQIFAISHGGIGYFPGYGLDRDAGFRPLKPLAKVIEIFAGHKDGWGMAYWFRSLAEYAGP